MNHAEIYILSKTFDSGTICASEQSVVVDQAVAEQVLDRFIAQGAYLLSDDEKRGAMSAAVVGQSAQKIAEVTGIHVPQSTKLLLARLNMDPSLTLGCGAYGGNSTNDNMDARRAYGRPGR